MNLGMRAGNTFIDYMKKDAVFNWEHRKVTMEFHRYCGPSFWLSYGQEGEDEIWNWFEIPELVEQFDGWWKAKGQYIYRSDR